MTTIRNNAAAPSLSSSTNPVLVTGSDGSGSSQTGASPFAALLQQHVGSEAVRPRAASPQAQPERAPSPKESAHGKAAREAEEPNNRQAVNQSMDKPASKTEGKAASKSGSKTPDKSGKTDKTAKAAEQSAQADQTSPADASEGASATTDPLAAWLAAMHGNAAAPAQVAATDATGAAGAATSHALTGLRGAPSEGLALEGRTGATLPRADAKADPAGFAALLATPGRAGDAADGNALGLAAVRMLNSGADQSQSATQMLAQQTQLVAEQTTALQGAAPIDSLDASAQAAALASLTSASAARTHTPLAPTVAAPVGSPGFANELADQVQVLVSKASLDAAAGSVHEARLNLNPVEMGPISIRIALDGNQAQVDFAAASGATRQALEDSMPALASALNGAGLTLSGGGVSQEFSQAQQEQAQQAASNGSRSSFTRSASGDDGQGAVQDITTSAANWVRRPEGHLDLYA